MNDPRSEYERRMNRVLDHIDRNLDAQLDLPGLADIANFSRYHFHRLFAAWMGETLGDYVRRRRLEVAAHKLAAGGTVLEVALSTGFGSGEAFARAFKTRFGSTPTEWRANTPARIAAFLAEMDAQHSNPDQANSKHGQAGNGASGQDEGSNNLNGARKMDVNVIDLPPARIAYRRHIGPYGPAVGQFWAQAVMPWMLGHGLAEATCYGIGHDDPSVTPADKCRYDACVEIPAGFEPGGQFSVANLPGGRYAVTRYTGSPRDIGPVWSRMMKEWLPSSGLQCDERPCFERYENLATQTDGSFTCEICIPVKAL
ncbi:GyrI-like domain-containing protein [Duganella sp. Root198D2]|uniref:AraC family transcriptional regulator n=1 Tax=Duganella sp. Root198D2 TaxID=1736489 RepID=UPI00071029AD|nr:GyrI-like domain-containing protein [Duganella sp. Root198D2]KRB81629.1 AraC family transcriptional regulator [Duganella sp. Root198D2]